MSSTKNLQNLRFSYQQKIFVIIRAMFHTEKLKKEFFSPSARINPVKFGTSGHRGKLGSGFCALHAKAIAQAVSKYHKEKNITGKILLGGDTRLMSQTTAEICADVLTANGHSVILSPHPLPTPVFSFFILNKTAAAGLNATASHNPPDDMGLKYNPKSAGPASKEITEKIEKYANYFLNNPSQIKLKGAKRLFTKTDLINPYINGLAKIIDFEIIRKSALKIAVHPLGGSAVVYFEKIKEKLLPALEITDKTIDPAFKFIPPDYDGKIRMDPSSPYPLKPALELARKGKFDIIGICDPDADRFGIVTKKGGLVSPNDALAVMLYYLLTNRKNFPKNLAVARSISTTHLLDKIASGFGSKVTETDVGFKYFTQGLLDKKFIIAGEESAGVSIYDWVTEKDGILAVMLACEIMAETGMDISDIYLNITKKYARPFYKRLDLPADEKVKENLKSLTAEKIYALKTLAGEKITDIRMTDGIKIYLEKSWVLARPSGTEAKIKFYAESFAGENRLNEIISQSFKIFGL